MKKLIFTLLISLFALNIVAQNEEHLKFKGIPIDGNLTTFISKMKIAGFKYISKENNTAIFKGNFAGYKNCTIVASAIETSKKVNVVGVKFQNCDNWAQLISNYNELKDMLTTKYGQPSSCIEKFNGYSYPDSDFLKLSSLKLDNCIWGSLYSTANGDIELILSRDEYLNCFVLLKYFDKINTDKVKSQAIEDL